MIEVRIRKEWDADSVRLMDVPFDKLDDVIPLIQRWGLYADGDVEWGRLFAQFKLDGSAAYFELVIGDE